MRVYDLNEIMKILKLSRPTIIKYIKNKELKAFKAGNSYRITEEAFREFIKKAEKI